MVVAWATQVEVLQMQPPDKHLQQSDQIKAEVVVLLVKIIWWQEQPKVLGLTANCQLPCNKNKPQIKHMAKEPLLDKFHHITQEQQLDKHSACQHNSNPCRNQK